MYVVMLQAAMDQWYFVKKKSYGEWQLVQEPEKATLYSRLSDAVARRKDIAGILARGCESRHPKVQRVEFTGYELHDVEDE